jgi:predicted AAA+ superfamily ATPase
MSIVLEISNILIENVDLRFRRLLFSAIDWENKLIEIKGARGTGKTTLMLQKAKECRDDLKKKVLYASLDLPYFYAYSIFDLALSFNREGGDVLFLDEVHKYPKKNPTNDWSSEIKAVHDSFPNLKVVYSGSSLIELHKGNGDLSRRKVSYNLYGFSFSEYRSLKSGEVKISTFSLTEVLKNHTEIAQSLTKKGSPLPMFQEYLKKGYYPFQLISENAYYQKLNEVVNAVIETEILSVLDGGYIATERIKKLLGAIATSVPYTPKIKELSSQLNISDSRTLLKYLELLVEAEILNTLQSGVSGNKKLQKPDKIYFNNTNLNYALAGESADIGTIRETFFLNQVGKHHEVTYPKSTDFLVEGIYYFEVGGKSKKRKQLLSHVENAFVVSDDIEIGIGNRIPLWLFGYLE